MSEKPRSSASMTTMFGRRVGAAAAATAAGSSARPAAPVDAISRNERLSMRFSQFEPRDTDARERVARFGRPPAPPLLGSTTSSRAAISRRDSEPERVLHLQRASVVDRQQGVVGLALFPAPVRHQKEVVAGTQGPAE